MRNYHVVCFGKISKARVEYLDVGSGFLRRLSAGNGMPSVVPHRHDPSITSCGVVGLTSRSGSERGCGVYIYYAGLFRNGGSCFLLSLCIRACIASGSWF